MKRSKSQLARLIELDRAIREKKYPGRESFAADYEVSVKTIQRDIDFLRDQLGAPIDYDRERKGYHYTDANWFLPALSMSEGDLLALLMASRAMEQYAGTPLSQQLQSMFARLTDLLPGKMSIQPELVAMRFSFIPPPSKPINDKIWLTLARAAVAQRELQIIYRSFESEKDVEWTLQPYHIANLQGEWYVFGVCPGETEIVQLSVARVKKAVLAENQFNVPGNFSPKHLLKDTFGRAAVGEKTYRVRILFSRDIAHWILERQWHPGQQLKTRRTGGVELSFKAKGLYEVQRWVLSWGRYAKVLEPMELVEMVKAELGQMRY